MNYFCLLLGLLSTPLFAISADLPQSQRSQRPPVENRRSADPNKQLIQPESPDGKPPRPWNTGYFGLYGGLNFSGTNPSVPKPADKPVDWQAGAYGRTGGVFFWQLGVEFRRLTTYYSLTGSSPSAGGTNAEMDRQNLLVFPTYLGLRFGTRVGFHLQAGAEVTTLLSTDYIPNAVGSNNLRRSNTYALGGGGIHAGPVTLDIIYHHGLQSIYSDSPDGSLQLLTLNLGVRL